MMQPDVFCARFLVDGPNICGVLGSVLGRKPIQSEWPRWDRILQSLEWKYGETDTTYVVNGNLASDKLWPFYRVLRGAGYRVEVPQGFPAGGDGDPVDDYIRQEIDATPGLVDGAPMHVILASHDHGYAPHLSRFIEKGGTVTIIAFREWLAPALLALEKRGATILDPERDLGGFDGRLDRPL